MIRAPPFGHQGPRRDARRAVGGRRAPHCVVREGRVGGGVGHAHVRGATAAAVRRSYVGHTGAVSTGGAFLHWDLPPISSESSKFATGSLQTPSRRRSALSRRGRELLERSCACTARQQDRDMNRRATNSGLVSAECNATEGLPFYPGPLAFSEEISTSILSSSHGQVPSTTSTVRPNTEEQRLDPGATIRSLRSVSWPLEAAL
jgi:hypothetical protein